MNFTANALHQPMNLSEGIPHILIADEHPIVRMGLGALIQSAFQQVRLSEAENGEMVKQMLGAGVFDLVILGTHMPDTEAFGLAAFLRKEYPGVKLLIFTMKRDFFYAKRFLKIGCHGYLNKHSTQSEIINAVLEVLSGKKILGTEFTQVMASQLQGETAKNPFEELSDRQFEIVLQILKKNSLSNIAEILRIQLSTVCTHKVRIFSKLKVSSTADLARLAKMYNII